ncbi:MAG: type VI secretion system contractile sheath small subunit [Niabella sp.]
MPLEPYGIGGTEVKNDAFEAFADIPQNRVLVAEKLTDLPPVRPEIVHGLTDVAAVFNHYNPSVEMDFETEEGSSKREELHFKGLDDFGTKGITRQSEYLSELDMKRAQYQKIVKQLKTNKLLKQALSDKNTKDNLVAALKVLVQELDGKTK